MDHYSILDQSMFPQPAEPSVDPVAADLGPAERRKETRFTHAGTHRPAPGSVTAAMAASSLSAMLARAPSVGHFSGEDPGHSMAEMAQRDLDAALQLLAERAQYITGASGAAIALRRGGFNDMQCRASAGPNAPELGALLSAEFGLSGESVRTRLPLRCDDTERDARVNREGCRQLGIASVAVMPIVTDDEVLGVFELFSGRVNAFEERDVSTLQRLGGMVETAVRLARTALGLPAESMGEFVAEVSDLPDIEIEAEAAWPAAPAETAVPASSAEEKKNGEIVHKVIEPADATLPDRVAAEPAVPVPSLPQPAAESAASVPPKKPLLWSAASQPATQAAETDQSHVPPVLRNLRKCQVCSFPVSEGRRLCVECEEKQWRGQLRGPKPVVAQRSAGAAAATAPAVSTLSTAARSAGSTPAERVASVDSLKPTSQVVGTSVLTPVAPSLPEKPVTSSVPPKVSETSEDALPFLSGAVSSESWLSANKYILGAIAVVAVVLAVIAMLR